LCGCVFGLCFCWWWCRFGCVRVFFALLVWVV
jgi:hypothetical protein